VTLSLQICSLVALVQRCASLNQLFLPLSYFKTGSQAVARITDRRPTAFGGHVTSSVMLPCHFLLVVLCNQASICNGFRDIQRQM